LSYRLMELWYVVRDICAPVLSINTIGSMTSKLR
jgi:hypothetical protein